MDFLFFYELKNREIETLALLKCELERRGYSCTISHFSAWGYGRNMLSNPKVIVVPWLRGDDNVYTFTRNIWRTKKLVDFQCEQIYSEADIRLGNALCTGIARRAYHLCWGNMSQKRLMDCGIDNNHLPITGCIKMDFFTPTFASLFQNRVQMAEKYSLQQVKSWFVFVSSLAYATYRSNDLEYLYQKTGDFSDFVAIHKETRLILLEWIDRYLKENNDVEFIYRPHPSEAIDDLLLKYESDISSFHIIPTESLQQWIQVSDVIDVWYTTGIAEVYYSGKVCNIVRPISIPQQYEIDFYKGGHFLTTYSEFAQAHEKPYNRPFPVDTSKITDTYSQSGIPNYIRTADVLEHILNDKKAQVNYYAGLPKQKYHTVRQYLKSLLGDIMRVFHLQFSKYFKDTTYMYEVLTYIEDKIDGIDDYILASCKKMDQIVNQTGKR
ncbi:surface carbohydrate biosynthesis protein [Oscillospiraceae bacterium PP1C4]